MRKLFMIMVVVVMFAVFTVSVNADDTFYVGVDNVDIVNEVKDADLDTVDGYTLGYTHDWVMFEASYMDVFNDIYDISVLFGGDIEVTETLFVHVFTGPGYFDSDIESGYVQTFKIGATQYFGNVGLDLGTKAKLYDNGEKVIDIYSGLSYRF